MIICTFLYIYLRFYEIAINPLLLDISLKPNFSIHYLGNVFFVRILKINPKVWEYQSKIYIHIWDYNTLEEKSVSWWHTVTHFFNDSNQELISSLSQPFLWVTSWYISNKERVELFTWIMRKSGVKMIDFGME